MVGTTVLHYRILERLGAGGMGVVYAAEDTRLMRTVAIKFLEQDRVTSDAMTRFMHEARTASSLNHPNICTVHDAGEFEGRPFLVMERLQGETLKELLGRGPLDQRRAVEILLQVAAALEAAHANGVVHRDIKPANIFITRDNQVKLLDFGIAKRTEAGHPDVSQAPTQLTQQGHIVGTVSYMSPEQALGKALDWRTDFFSLGVVAYEMATGRLPFDEETSPAIVDAIIHNPPEGWEEVKRDIQPGLGAVVLKLLEKAPDKRYQSASHLIADLRAAQAGKARPRWPSGRTSRLVRSGALAALGLALVLALAFSLNRRWDDTPPAAVVGEAGDPDSRPILAILRPTSLGSDPFLDDVGRGVAYALATGLSAAPSVTMISPAATLGLQSEGKQPGEIARDLGANYVVTGAVQKAGAQVRVSLNLLRGNSIVWGDAVAGGAEDLFAIQQELVKKVSQALRLVHGEEDQGRLQSALTNNKEAYADYLQARAFLERGPSEENLEHAVRLFESALARDPDFSLAHAGLGEAYWATYERDKDPVWTDRAREETEKALRLAPNLAAVRRSLAIILNGGGDSPQAEQELRKAIELEPNNDEGYRLLGEALLDQGKTDQALEAFRQAIALRPAYWGNHRALGLAYFGKGRYAEAAKSFERITQLQPDLSLGFQYLGVTYHALGELDSARRNYEEALKRGPSPAAYANLGTIYYRQGDYAKASQYYEDSLRLAPKSAVNLRNLGDVYRKMGLSDKAEAVYVQALELTRDQSAVNPNNAQLLAMAALLEAKLGRSLEAARHADQALAKAPRDGQVLYRRAVVHALGGQPEEAMRLLKKALGEGFSASEAILDDDLATLRGRRDFQTLTNPQQKSEGELR